MDSEKRYDCICDADENYELILPIAHYALINSNYNGKSRPKLVIHGLGSCVALILYDNKNKVYAMSHILLADFKNSDINTIKKYPHKYVFSSVKNLLEEILNHGAEKSNIRAIIVGGAKIFQNQFNDIGKKNVKILKEELEKFNIKIEKEDTGGTQGRTLIYDTNNNSILIHYALESEFRRLI